MSGCSLTKRKMKYLVLLSIVIAASAANVPKDLTAGYKEGDRFFYFPGDGDNILHLVDTQEPVDYELIRNYGRNPDNNAYWLYTRTYPDTPQVLELYNEHSVYSSNFDSSKMTVFLVHGWNGDGNNNFNRMLTEAFLSDDDVNVIVLDWSRLANRNYLTARNGVPAVGRGLGQFINWMCNNLGASYSRIHLVGFSLGGHLIGSAGRETGGAVQRITALDPAGPLWSGNRDRLIDTDAQYVEVIHTNTGLLGYTDPCGDADFYPNGGTGMPGCLTNSCSHSKAYDYMASSVKYDHLHANQCDTLRDATRNSCQGALNPMGNSRPYKTESGIFRVNTQRNYPY